MQNFIHCLKDCSGRWRQESQSTHLVSDGNIKAGAQKKKKLLLGLRIGGGHHAFWINDYFSVSARLQTWEYNKFLKIGEPQIGRLVSPAWWKLRFFRGPFFSTWHCLVGFSNACGICEEENVWRWFLEAFHICGVSVGDPERGGTSAVPSSVHL